MSFHSKNIPNELKIFPQWVCYRTTKLESKTAKYMISPVTRKFAKSNDPHTWTDYNTAFHYMIAKRLEGLAFVLTEGIVFVDIDHVTDENGTMSLFAQKILEELPKTYAERSVSGNGIHIFCKGRLPKNALKRNDKLGLEMYDTKRFVCITGDIIDHRKEILECEDLIQSVHERYIGKRIPYVQPKTIESVLTDNEIVSKIRESKQGQKFEMLYSGNISGYPSHSNADYAFVKILAFWTQDKSQIDSIVRSSGLYREKWDRKIGNNPYGEITIENALMNQHTIYNRHYEME